MKRGWLKNTALATILSTTLTACGGGGGGGGAVGVVSDFVQEDLSSLSGSSNIVGSFSNLIQDFKNEIEDGDFGSFEAVITGPTAEDKQTAKTLLSQLDTAVDLWTQSENLIENLTEEQARNYGDGTKSVDQVKYAIYNSDKYKKAYAAMIYLKEHVKPIIKKVSEGNTITLADYKKVAEQTEADKIIEQEETTNALAFSEQKKIKSTIPQKTEVPVYDQVEDAGDPVTVPASDDEGTWTIVEGKGGQEKRKLVTTTPQKRVIKTEICTWTDVVKLTETGSKTVPTEKKCYTETDEFPVDSKTSESWEYRAGENPVIKTVFKDDKVSDPVEEFNMAYGTDGIHTSGPNVILTVDKDPEVTAGAEETGTTEYTKQRTEPTGTKNQVWVIVDKWLKTTTVKPITTRTVQEVTYETVRTKQKRSWTITTKVKEVFYKDGTKDIIETPGDKVYTNWETVQITTKKETFTEYGDPVAGFLAPDVKDKFITQVSKTLKNNAYTDDDEDLGTRTVGLSTDPDDFKTPEFNKDSSKSMINADKAYARGWTGKGAVLGVIDTWQQTDHPELDGKYKWYNDYVLEKKDSDGNVIEDYVLNNTPAKTWSHGTQVAGIIAGKNDGNGMHGVAFDAELVGANIDQTGFMRPHIGIGEQALADMAKLKSPKEDGGEGMNIVAVNMSYNRNSPISYVGMTNFKNGNLEVEKLNDGTYKSPEVINRDGATDLKVATDSDIILVNSAGNGVYYKGTLVPGGLDYSLDPGIWATKTDNGGNLVLGGKMIIVGNWGGTKSEGQVVGNKAGHLCHDVDELNNVCNDKYKVSDFYILAPGYTYSSAADSGYDWNNGSSFSAPQVTGAMGILHQMWPHMKGENLVKLVLNTADKDINNYNVNIHGQGMLDLDEATKPQGAIGIPTSGRVDNPTRVTLTNTKYIATNSFAAFTSLKDLKIMVLDDYDRDYYINLGDSFTVKDNRKYSDTSLLVNNNHTFLPMQQMYGSFTQGGQWDLVQNYNFGFYTGESGNGDYSANVGKNFFITDKFKLKTGVGTMSEQDTWLGNSSDGVLAVGDNNDTNFGNIGVDYQIGNNVLSLDYTRGWTDINTVDNSLIKSFSDVETESYRLAYEIHKDKHNTLGWSFSLPSHITSGTMDLEVAESVNLDGTINYANITSDLTQQTKEKNIGFYLNHTPEHDTDAAYNFTAEYRQDVAGQSGKDGLNLAMNYTKKFWGACKFLWMKNPKCYTKDENGKEVLTAESQALMFGNKNVDTATKLGLRYDLKTDMFVPINPEDTKWKQ